MEQRHHFANLISSELRTPLAILDIAVDMLRRYSDRMTEDQKNKQIARITEVTKTIRYTIDRMAHVERWLNSDIPFHPETRSIPTYTSDYLKDLGERVVIEFATEIDEITIDTSLLHLIVHELTSNALKFSPEESQVRLTFNASERELIIIVSDHGIGIPEADYPRMFEPHFHASNNRVAALGFGLHIVSESVKRYGGKIEWTSEVDKGTTFEVHLPLPW